MEKRALIAIALSFLVLVLWTRMFPPPKRTPPPAPIEEALDEPFDRRATEVEPQTFDPTIASPDATQDPEAQAATIAAEGVEETVVKHGPYEVVLTNQGGRAVSWKLRDYSTPEGVTLELVPRFENNTVLPLSIDMDDETIAEELNEALFHVTRTALSRDELRGSGERIEYRWSGSGLDATKTFTFWDQSWLVDIDLQVIYRGRRLPTRLAVGPGFGAQESSAGKGTYAYATRGVWNIQGDVSKRDNKPLTKEDGGFSGNLRWAGLEDQYFVALVLPDDEQSQVKWRSIEMQPLPLEGVEQDEKELKRRREPVLSVEVPEAGAMLFVGPKKFSLLKEQGFELEKTVFRSRFKLLAWVTRQIFFGLAWIHDHVAANYGMAIILATFCLRVLLFPVNQYSMVSMKKAQLQMQRLQPKIKRIKDKYKKLKDAKSRASMNQETMDLYKREGVNPMGGITGCLPLLAQFPILIGFYKMLTVAVELRGAPFFGWIQDLSREDPFWVIPLLMGVTMFVQQKMAMSKVKDPMQQQQQKIMMFMPIIFTYICLHMPAGMVLYWFVNNVLGIGQQWLVNRHTGRLEAAAQKA